MITTPCDQGWVRDPPTETGWYWFRDAFGSLSDHPVKIYQAVPDSEWWAFGIYMESRPVKDYFGYWWPERIPRPTDTDDV